MYLSHSRCDKTITTSNIAIAIAINSAAVICSSVSCRPVRAMSGAGDDNDSYTYMDILQTTLAVTAGVVGSYLLLRKVKSIIEAPADQYLVSKRLLGKGVIITGATSGIGRAGMIWAICSAVC